MASVEKASQATLVAAPAYWEFVKIDKIRGEKMVNAVAAAQPNQKYRLKTLL